MADRLSSQSSRVWQDLSWELKPSNVVVVHLKSPRSPRWWIICESPALSFKNKKTIRLLSKQDRERIQFPLQRHQKAVWPFGYLILNYKWRNEVFIQANQIELNCVLRCHDKVYLAYFWNEPLQFALCLSISRTVYILLETWILTLVACTLTYLSFWTSLKCRNYFLQVLLTNPRPRCRQGRQAGIPMSARCPRELVVRFW